MKDRFKFRCFFTDENKMYFYDYFFPAYIMDEKEAHIMQSTGLKDKNGKLIYEGDIVKFSFDRDKIIGVITWDNEHQFCFYINTTDYFKDKYVIDYDFLKGYKYEVIGNIYENKELLNE